MKNSQIFSSDFIYLFLERWEGRQKERALCARYINQLPLTYPAKGTWPATQACALTGNQAGDSLVHRLVLNPLSHTSQDYKNFVLTINKNSLKISWTLNSNSLSDTGPLVGMNFLSLIVKICIFLTIQISSSYFSLIVYSTYIRFYFSNSLQEVVCFFA